jgi:TPP-dependent pyruvate/acetoin dehydrogenase alpha subunit
MKLQEAFDSARKGIPSPDIRTYRYKVQSMSDPKIPQQGRSGTYRATILSVQGRIEAEKTMIAEEFEAMETEIEAIVADAARSPSRARTYGKPRSKTTSIRPNRARAGGEVPWPSSASGGPPQALD